jgi:adenine phosphoribosyltransferase
MVMPLLELGAKVRNVPDFPKKGIVFRDITTLLKDPEAFKGVNDILFNRYKNSRIDKVVGVESRGFIFASSLAQQLGVGFVPIRKSGKLPSSTLREQYSLEYGMDSIEIHQDAIMKGERVLLHDDLLATGGTIGAAVKLVERLGGTIVEIAFLIELRFLEGRQHLKDHDVFSIIQYDSE